MLPLGVNKIEIKRGLTSVSYTHLNQLGRNAEMEKAIKIPDKGDDYDEVRQEFRNMLKEQLSKGNNGLKKSKYITFTLSLIHI